MRLRVRGKVAQIYIEDMTTNSKGQRVLEMKFVNVMRRPNTESVIEMLKGDSVDLSGTIDIEGSAWSFILAIIFRRPVKWR